MKMNMSATLMIRKTISDAFEGSVENIRTLLNRMEGRIESHPPLLIPCTLEHESGMRDPSEK
jgi:hypothetical protein